ncbi:MAG: hypothetical protein Q9169_006593 [Polycauliona sp. 2 TL-2023]
MFPSAIWRPLAASITILVIIVHSWLSNIVMRGGRPPGYDAAGMLGPKTIHHQNTLKPIPKTIWQIFFSRPIPQEYQNWIQTWEKKNPLHQHIVLDDQAGQEFVRQHYSHDPYVMETYLSLTGTILRSDYLRYLVIAAEGGVYTDSDTDAIRPIDAWIPEHLEGQVRAIVGLEFDILDRAELPPEIYIPVQFCQWAFASSAHHPLMDRMVQAVTREIHDLAIMEGVGLSDLRPRNNQDVLFASGPVKWTQEVFAYLSSATGTEVTYRNFTGITEPTLVGDVMIMPIKAFATGMAGSGGGGENSEDTLLRHIFRGAWKAREGIMPVTSRNREEGEQRAQGNGARRRKKTQGQQKVTGEARRKSNGGGRMRQGN